MITIEDSKKCRSRFYSKHLLLSITPHKNPYQTEENNGSFQKQMNSIELDSLTKLLCKHNFYLHGSFWNKERIKSYLDAIPND